MPLVLLLVLTVVALAAPRYGVDSRRLCPGQGPAHRGPTPWGDVQALVSYVLRSIERAATRPSGPNHPTVALKR